MARDPRVSVVVIFLDEERFLPEAVESVLAQTYSNWELILVDDGSTDRSAEIAKELAAGDGRIRYVTHSGGGNRGMSASRNRGVAVSSGELVAFLDADDVWLPEKLAEQVELLELHPEVAMVYGRTQWWFSWDPSSVQQDYLYDPAVPLDSVVEPPSLVAPLIRNDGNPPYTCSMLIRRGAYERLGGFEESFRALFEDQAFFAKVFLDERVFVSGHCWDRYRQHEESACSVGLRTGELHPLDLNPAREAFLSWLDRYLRAKHVADDELLDLLANELEPYRFPVAPAVVEWVETSERDPKLAGASLDFPQSGTRAAGRRIHVMGWAMGDRARVRAAELWSGNSSSARRRSTKPRPDLVAAFPDRKEAQAAGFRTSVSLVGMSPLEVSVVAVLEDGACAEIGRFRATRCFRSEDADIGYPLVSVVILATDGARSPESAGEPDGSELSGLRGAGCGGNQRARGSCVGFSRCPLRDGPIGTPGCGWPAGHPRISGALHVRIRSVAAGLPRGRGRRARRISLGGTRGGSARARPVAEYRPAVRAGRRRRSRRTSRVCASGPSPAASRPRTPVGGTLILMYHRVADAIGDPWGLAVSPELFRDQLELLASEYEVASLEHILRAGTNGRRIAITFDDGYADNLAAARALAERALPATFFLVGGQLGSDREFWWDELERIVLAAPQLPEEIEIAIGDELLRWDLTTAESGEDSIWRASAEPHTPRQRLYMELYRRLSLFDHRKREDAISLLADRVGQDRVARSEMRALSLSETSEFAAIEGIEVGAHTLTHPRLSTLGSSEQRKEIAGSRRLLEEIIGRPVKSFAYPHGTYRDYTPETVAIVADCGFRRACAAEGGVLERDVSPFELSRLMVENWSVGDFERRVHDAFAEASS